MLPRIHGDPQSPGVQLIKRLVERAKTDDPGKEIKALYQRAFQEFGSAALWNMQPAKEPSPADGRPER